MLIGLKGDNYYSKVFKRVNYKLSNNMFRVVITPPPDDTERASLSGSTPSGFPKEEAHGTCEHHTPDNSISYLDMLSGSLTKASKPCYVIPTACHNHVPPPSDGVSGRPVRTSLPWIPKNSPQSRIVLVIKKLSKHHNLTQFD